MPALEILNLSRTRIKSLPESLFRLSSLKRLFLNHCELLMALPPKIGELQQLEVLDLEGTEIMDLPKEVADLTKLTCLEVSFCPRIYRGTKSVKANALIPQGTISALSQLEELSIDVNPEDERWESVVEAIVDDVCGLLRLDALKLYLPRVEHLRKFKWIGTSKVSRSLSHFKFIVGNHDERIMSRLPMDLEFELERWDRSLKYVNGVGVPTDIQKMLQHTAAFFLDRHTNVTKLSDFGIENMEQLKCCIIGECNEIHVIIDGADMYDEADSSEIVLESWEDDKSFLGSLEYLYVYHMKSLRGIYEGPMHRGCLSHLKCLALLTCPRLTTIFTPHLLKYLDSLEDLKVEDCPLILSLVTCEDTSIYESAYFLPNLKSISLFSLPELISISNGLRIAPNLERMSISDCPNLESPSTDGICCNHLTGTKAQSIPKDASRELPAPLLRKFLSKDHKLAARYLSATSLLDEGDFDWVSEVTNTSQDQPPPTRISFTPTSTTIDSLRSSTTASNTAFTSSFSSTTASNKTINYLARLRPDGRNAIKNIDYDASSTSTSLALDGLSVFTNFRVHGQEGELDVICPDMGPWPEDFAIPMDAWRSSKARDLTPCLRLQRPPVLSPPAVMLRPVVDNVSSTWDLLNSFGPQEGPGGDKDSPVRPSNEEEWSDGDDEKVSKERTSPRKEDSVSCLSTLAEDKGFKDKRDVENALSADISELVCDVSSDGCFKRRITSWQKGERLGSGSFGTVYEGISDDGFFFAIKEVSLLDQGSQGKQSLLQLEQEISFLSQFEHENIVRYLGTDKDDEKLYIFLELMTKGSLATLYHKYNLRDSQVSGYTRQILNGLKYLHDQNVVHRDIKCANILVDASGAVKLADFGLAKATKMNDAKSSKGTAFWMAPEVINPKYGGHGLAADIWSLGCTVLEMLTGRPPYSHLERAQALFQIGRGQPPPVPDSLSRDARDLILRCLQVNPNDRPSAAQLLDHPFVRKPPTSSSFASPRFDNLWS